MVKDPFDKLGSVIRLDEKSAAEPLTVNLGPLVTVHAEFDPKRLSGWRIQPEYAFMNVSLSTPPVEEYLADWNMGYGKFTVKLPPGDYKLFTYGNAQGFTRTISLRADEPILNLGRIELDVPIIERQTGKVPPPWNVTDARGVGRDVKPTDFRGKWVLVEFWAYW